jgi:hypothetical protein
VFAKSKANPPYPPSSKGGVSLPFEGDKSFLVRGFELLPLKEGGWEELLFAGAVFAKSKAKSPSPFFEGAKSLGFVPLPLKEGGWEGVAFRWRAALRAPGGISVVGTDHDRGLSSLIAAIPG